MPKHLPQSSQRTKQIKAHNKKALAEGRPDDILPEQSATQIWEPWEYNAEIAKRAQARGDEVNIAKPRLPQGFVMTTKPPVMRDLVAEAQDRAKGIKKGRKAFKGGVSTERPD